MVIQEPVFIQAMVIHKVYWLLRTRSSLSNIAAFGTQREVADMNHAITKLSRTLGAPEPARALKSCELSAL